MTLPTPAPIPRLVEVARAAARAAGTAAMAHWRRLAHVETKPDGSPVTIADREAEAAAVAVIRAASPSAVILGEEGGAYGGEGETRWVIDPIDGTLGYARGGMMWGPLVAYEHRGEVVAGAMELPALRLSYWAGRGLGCFRDGTRVHVSPVATWSDAIVSMGGMRRLLVDHPQSAALAQLIRTSRSSRCYGDVGSVTMLLDGVAEVWIEDGVQRWDLAAPRILVEEAGGRFTAFDGTPTHARGQALATNGRLHDHALAVLAGAR